VDRRVAVVGATGFLGSHLVERLVRDGASVLAIARSEKRRMNLDAVKGAYAFEICDIVDRSCVGRALSEFRPDTVFHLAAKPDAAEEFEHMEEALGVNTLGTLHVLEASKLAGVRDFVFAGSSKVYGNHEIPTRSNTPVDPVSSYAIGKYAGWQLCKLYGLTGSMRVTGIQPAFVYGPRQNWNLLSYVADCVAKNKPVHLMGGKQTRDPLFIDDAVDAFLAARKSPRTAGLCIPVGGGCEIAVSELSRAVLDVLGSSLPVVCGAQEPRPTEIWRNFTDNSEATVLFDWRPRVGLAEGLRRTFGLAPRDSFDGSFFGLSTPRPRVSGD
jgi:UDP-glucose 4-epimerase